MRWQRWKQWYFLHIILTTLLHAKTTLTDTWQIDNMSEFLRNSFKVLIDILPKSTKVFFNKFYLIELSSNISSPTTFCETIKFLLLRTLLTFSRLPVPKTGKEVYGKHWLRVVNQNHSIKMFVRFTYNLNLQKNRVELHLLIAIYSSNHFLEAVQISLK